VNYALPAARSKNMLRFIDPDRIASQYLGTKVKSLILLGVLITGFWLATTEVSVIEFFFCFYLSVLLLRVGIEVGYHRYFAHRSYKTTKFKERLLLIWGTLVGVGSCLSWVGVHRTHHRYTDTDKDPHSPNNIGIIRVWLTLWADNWHIDPSMVKDLLRDKLQMFLHRNYFKVMLSWILFLGLTSYLLNSFVPIVVLFALPSALTIFVSGITNALGHRYGYRTFETDECSTNQHTPRWLLLNAGLHNNHHAKPDIWWYNVRNNWYEFDVEGLIIKHFFKI
jgi:stearoyl-CoA desaturase (delta-9 desaturase)